MTEKCEKEKEKKKVKKSVKQRTLKQHKGNNYKKKGRIIEKNITKYKK